jgi:serine/threonine protein kinase
VPSRGAALVGRKIAQYIIVRPLSKGNFATIYLAQNETGAHFALKVIEARDATSLIERFIREFDKLKAAVNHAGVLRCFETDVTAIEGREYQWYSMLRLPEAPVLRTK